MKFYKFILFLAVVLFSCINIKVPIKYTKFNPYCISDILVFKSSSGSIDTVIITNVREKHVDRQNLPHLIGRNSIEVVGVPLSDYGFNRKRLATSPVIVIYPKKALPGNTIFLGLHINSNYILSNFIQNLDSLIDENQITLKISDKLYNDVIIINTANNRPNHVCKVYWSKKHGILRLVNCSKDSADLISKFQDQELYNKYKDTNYY